MARSKPPYRKLAAASLAAAAALLPGLALAASPRSRQASAAPRHSLLQSRLLWATIDICSPSDKPDTVGVRGSMPGDGQPHDAMYMSFRLQYLSGSGTAAHWTDLPNGGGGFVSVGNSGSVRHAQAGRSFTLVPVPGKPSTLRGVVTFEWRRAGAILQSTSRPTTAGHKSETGADPKSFTAATCTIS
jgi:hypothetical protein